MHRECAPLILGLAGVIDCVPEGPPTADAGPASKPPVVIATRPSASPATSSAPAVAVATRPDITAPWQDDFDRVELGPDYNALTPKWHIVGARLCGKGARNHGVWLLRKLPTNARVEFDAFAETAD